MGERPGEVGPGLDLQEDVRQVHAREQTGHRLAERPQAGGFVQFVQRGQCQRVSARDHLDADGLVGREIVGGPSIGVVELAAE